MLRTGRDAKRVFGKHRSPAGTVPPGASGAPDEASASWRDRIAGSSAFCALQASLSQTALLVVVGLGMAIAPAGWRNVARPINMPAQPTAAQAPCPELLVFFSEMATVGEVSALVGGLGGAVVAGPSAAGAFELAVPAGAADAVAASLGQAEDLVEGVFFKSRCATP